jgi:Arc-like DNA binding domain
MAYRKSLIQVKFRLRQDILRKLEREAKRHDRSTNDEIGRRLEESFSYLREDILRKLEREAKRHDRSTKDEIERRLEESFSYGDWREEREQLLLALRTDLASHPNPAATKTAFAKMVDSAERDIQKEFMEEEFPTKGRKS